MSPVIVYVHGLWQRGAEAVLLRRRLARDLAADVRVFSYPSVAADATAHARALAEYLCAIRADTLHLIGHSLGGLVIVKLFEEHAIDAGEDRERSIGLDARRADAPIERIQV